MASFQKDRIGGFGEHFSVSLMEERKIGLVPRVLMSGAMGLREYGILITDKRTIAVLEKGGRTGVGWALGGAVGAAIAQAVASRREIDYSSASADLLAADKKNIAIPHDAVSVLRVKKGFFRGAPKLLIEYTRPDGKRKKLKALLEPPSELMRQRKGEGAGRKNVLLEYAAKVREAYLQALPSSVALKAEWSF